jgi:hypothetical protein
VSFCHKYSLNSTIFHNLFGTINKCFFHNHYFIKICLNLLSPGYSLSFLWHIILYAKHINCLSYALIKIIKENTVIKTILYKFTNFAIVLNCKVALKDKHFMFYKMIYKTNCQSLNGVTCENPFKSVNY